RAETTPPTLRENSRSRLSARVLRTAAPTMRKLPRPCFRAGADGNGARRAATGRFAWHPADRRAPARGGTAQRKMPPRCGVGFLFPETPPPTLQPAPAALCGLPVRARKANAAHA